MSKAPPESVMLKTLHDTEASLLAQLQEIDEWLKDGSANDEEYDALCQEKDEIEQQVHLIRLVRWK